MEIELSNEDLTLVLTALYHWSETVQESSVDQDHLHDLVTRLEAKEASHEQMA